MRYPLKSFRNRKLILSSSTLKTVENRPISIYVEIFDRRLHLYSIVFVECCLPRGLEALFNPWERSENQSLFI